MTHPTAYEASRWRRLPISWRTSLVRLCVVAVAAIVVARLHIAGRPTTLCPFRALTGIPCPICGTTTAGVDLGHLDIGGALRANPFTVLAGFVLVAAPASSSLVKQRRPFFVSARLRRLLPAVCVAVIALSEIWQLARFNII